MSTWPGKRLGLSNDTSESNASGMWRVNESFLAIKNSNWPVYVAPLSVPIQDGLTFAVDTSAKTIVSAKIYSTFSGLRSANYTVQYSDNNSNWTTAFSGVMSNNSSYGLQTGTNSGDGSYGAHRYWRYVEGAAVTGHHPRTSRMILTDSAGIDYNIIVYANDNQSDSGGYQIGTVSSDISLADFSAVTPNLYVTGNTAPAYDANNGGVLTFNGSSDYVQYNGSLFGSASSNSMTFGMWTYTSGTTTQEWAAQWASSNSGNSWFFGPRAFSGGNASIHAGGDGWSVTQPIELNTWIYWLTVNDVQNNNAYLYKNGVLVATKGSKVSTTGVATFYLGKQGSLNGEYFNGKLGPMHGWNRALSGEEVETMYNLYSSRF